MKKLIILIMFFMLVTIYSCNNINEPELIQTNNSEIISFNSFKEAFTRADHIGNDAASLLNNNFVVEGVKGDGTNQEVVFDHYNVNYIPNTAGSSTTNTHNWEYVSQPKNSHSNVDQQTTKYWDFSTSQYDFIAYSLGVSNGIDISDITPSTITTSAYTVSGNADELSKIYISDLTTAYQIDNDYNNTVTLYFKSLSSKIRIGIYETIPGYSVKDVVFYTNENTKATDGNTYLYTSNGDVYNETGTYTIYFPTVGYSNKGNTDYNKAHLSFTPATSGTSTIKNFGALNNYVTKELDEATGNYLGRSSNEVTFAGITSNNYYITTIPNETGVTLNLKVDFKMISIDGTGEIINVTGAKATVPSVYSVWKHGYAYTYIFKLSQDTNGYTGDPGTTPAGLYPITFDCIVAETTDGIQETITTIATPSITTYAKGAISNEYNVNSNIYIVVDNGTALTVGTNANLYTVTIENGAIQTINESSIANVIKNGTYDDTEKTYTVTDANNKKMIVTQSDLLTSITSIPASDSSNDNAITINGCKFTPTNAGIYAFEYINGTNKHYKIIKVN